MIDKKKRMPIKAYGQLLYQYMRPMRWRVVAVFVLLLISIGCQLLSPLALRQFIDLARTGGSISQMYGAAILFVVWALAGQALHVLVVYMGENVGWRATNALRAELMAHYFTLDRAQQQSFSTGEMIERIDGDVHVLQNFFSHFVISLLGNTTFIVGILIVFVVEDWRIGVVMTMFIMIAFWAIDKMRLLAVPYWQRLRAVIGDFFGFLTEQLAAREEARANGGRTYVLWQFEQLLHKWYPVSKQAHVRGYAMWMTTIFVFTLGNVVAFGLSAWLFQAGIITIGTVVMVFYFTELLIKPIEHIRYQLEDLQKADASILRVKALFQLQATIRNEGEKCLPDGALSVSMRNVSFGYAADTPVLEDIYIQLRATKVLGLLGKTGSGKTTLARLLLRFYEPDEGAIKLGDVAVSEVAQSDLRARVGFVTQDVQLLKATVRDNVTFFDPHVSDEKIITVIDELGLASWYRTLPHGLDTYVGEEGVQLSAGEAQLLVLVRVFLANPGLIILDEASARLDPATEQVLDQAMRRLLAGRTAIIIAHRLATIAHVDEVLILNHGRVLEYGKREQLASTPHTHFYKLLHGGRKELLQ
ncbi:ABC transporter ATP-binding protein [Shouchella lonarensis]|uniref:ATP-binding cassette, subfamily B/ATP-binding cassette, subfamily C n=1 Tax=Shouchella lonarensis TaxID=1464122 RepID=A0A1G6N8I9_9BACI|nr:ABC transporter ATP-binding protein [Shouchella lonarensis]SDC63576.1 ATP-binding cassette, subfamily B/ATP-binding cassette, subfamily C [Shouchella lonarensis]